MEPSFIQRLITDGLPCAQIEVTGDGAHFDALIVSAAFTDKGTLARHRLVYAALGGRMESGEIHALSMRTFTPEEWAAEARG
jgi:acid stress-induced BolA-like protein IbaG/YrbA